MAVSELAFINLAKELIDVKEKIKFLQKRESEISERLKQECSYQTTSVDGYTFEKFKRVGNVQYNKIDILKNVNLDSYRSEDVEMWKLSYLKEFDI